MRGSTGSRVVAIIQARMGSTRLPGKVLLPLASRPTIDWVVARTEIAGSVSQVVVATSESDGDDVLVDHCLANGWSVFRGSESDVLDRYHKAARAFGADVVVRITGDCPLVDPDVVDQVVGSLRVEPVVDYAANILEPRTYPRGLDVEAFTTDALHVAWKEDGNPAWREHVTPYIYRNPDRFRLRHVVGDVDLSHMRWTLDTPEDLKFLRRLLAKLPDMYVPWREILRIVQENREWQRLNADVVQKHVE